MREMLLSRIESNGHYGPTFGVSDDIRIAIVFYILQFHLIGIDVIPFGVSDDIT